MARITRSAISLGPGHIRMSSVSMLLPYSPALLQYPLTRNASRATQACAEHSKLATPKQPQEAESARPMPPEEICDTTWLCSQILAIPSLVCNPLICNPLKKSFDTSLPDT